MEVRKNLYTLAQFGKLMMRKLGHRACGIGISSKNMHSFSDNAALRALTSPIPQLAVVVPTFNECENVHLVAAAIDRALEGIAYEIIFVDDDSPDGTAANVRRMARHDIRIRVLQRVGRRGLASACVEGMLASSSPYIAVMDADLQHDESVLPAMFRKLCAENLDIVIASRHAEGGSMGQFSKMRVHLSNLGLSISNAICRNKMGDPMSGFFVLQRGFLDDVVHHTSAIGFKILVDLVASSPRPVAIGEIGYVFRNRIHGQSKLDINVALEYLLLVADKVLGGFLPVQFLLFVCVGTLGVALYLLVLGELYRHQGIPFLKAQAIATAIAVTLNFVLNNLFTYRSARLRGWLFLRGLLVFWLVCGLGALSNLALAQFLFERSIPWYISATTGLVVSAAWNYGATAVLVWRRHRPRPCGRS
jgi:dolichol-phosphate mannosyltransferase